MKRERKAVGSKVLATAVVAACAGLLAQSASATSVFSDNFDRSDLNGGAYTYTTTATGDGGASIVSNVLTLTNDASGASNANGTVALSVPTSSFTSPFNPVLDSNTGNVLTWTFNMEQIRPNPSGLTSGSYGAAFILGGTSSNFATAGTGYAVVVGNGSTPDPIKLVKYTAGVATSTSLAFTSSQDMSTNFYSIKVTFDPSTSTWSMFTRNDSTTAFSDPQSTATPYVQSGSSVIDNTYTGTALGYMGAFWAFSTSANQVARFDNVNVDAAPPSSGGPTPRDLVWNGTSGNWETSNNWLDSASAATWNSGTPDNATLGAAGSKTVTLGSGQSVGSLTITAPGYTIAGSPLSIIGAATVGLVANESVTIASDVAVSAPQSWTVASGKTVSVTGHLTSSGQIIKNGPGTLTLTTPNPAFSGAWNVTDGKVSVIGSDDGGYGGGGSGAVTVGAATYELVNAKLGLTTSLGQPSPSNPFLITLNNGATLQGIGSSAASGTVAAALTGSMALRAPGAGDSLLIGSAMRNAATAATTSTAQITVSGDGLVRLLTGGTSTNPSSATQFSGSWLVNMGATGVFQVGPLLSGGFGEPLNGLGYNLATSGTGGYSGMTRPVTVTGGTLALGSSSNNAGDITATSYRSPITLDGGNLAATAGANPKTSADLTINPNKTSKVLTYDPLNPGTATTIDVMTDGAVPTTSVAGTLNWGAGSTLVVDAGATTGGLLRFSRTADAANAVTVGAGAKLSITTGATVELGGGQDVLYDGTNAVTVANAGTLNVTAGVKHAGAITGTGTTNVSGGTTLAIKAGSATSIQSAVNIDGSSLLDLNNNKLAIDYTGSTVADAVRGQLQSGRGSGAWDGTTGITTSSGKPASDANQVTAIGYAEASQVVGAGGGTWAGVGVDGSALLLKYTYYGDANLDGKIDGSDYTLLDKGFNSHVSNAHWTDGDFNYDGQVNSDDYMLADVAFGHQSGGVLSPDFLAQREIQFGEAYVTSLVAAVPEPTSLGLVGVAAAGLLGRRRRSAK